MPQNIECAPAVLKEIRVAAMDAFFSVPHGGAEIGGVLYGMRRGGRACILACRPLDCEHALGPTFTLSENDHQRLRALLGQCPEGLEPLGWYHSHTRSELILSERDIEIHDRYFLEPWQVALVVRPHAMKPMRAAFFFREADGSIHAESSHSEFLLQPAAAPAAPLATERPPATVQRAPAAGLPQAPRSRRWLWWTVLAPALLLVGGFLVPTNRTPPPVHPPPISLLAFDLDGQLQIQWDRTAAPIRGASSGTLEINDGPAHAILPLDAAHLHAGTVIYARRTGRVDVRLSLSQSGGETLDEFTTFLGGPPPPVAHLSIKNH
jgi:proteasome lid subunit RPN8/RPN11